MILYRKSLLIERVFFYYIIMKAVFELIALILSYILENNLIGLHIYTVVQYALLTIFFRSCFTVFRIKFPFLIILLIGSILITVNSIFLQPFDTFNSNARFLVEAYMLFASMILFTLFIANREHDQEKMKAIVSFVSAVFLEGAGSLIFYLYSNKMLLMKKVYLDALYAIKISLNFLVLFIIMYGLLQIAIRNTNSHKMKTHGR